MMPILSPAGAIVLDDVVRRRTLLAFDFDGTLAPIIADRAFARMRSETAALLRTASLLFPCAVISGRARADVLKRVADVPLAAVIGNHGAERGFGPLDRSLARRVTAWGETLRRSLRHLRGVEIEDKRFSVAVHYRRTSSWRESERQILGAAAGLDEATAFGGHAVVNILPSGAPTKGDAIRALCERERASLAVYVGDDRTDEEAFRADRVGISIRVGASETSSARYSLADQSQIDHLLRALIAARARHDGLGERWEGLVRAVALG
jgi:trehalose 6-phosphate phosphatase